MKNVKFSLAFAAFGFCLSFVVGLFSGAHAARVFLMALLFGAVFAALGFAVGFLLGGVLNVESGDSDAPAAQDAAPKGSVVNVVVQDEELPSDDGAPRFVVGSNRSMLSPSDYGERSEGGGDVAGSSAGSAPREAPAPAVAPSAGEGRENPETAARESGGASARAAESPGGGGKAKGGDGFVPISLVENAQNVSGAEAVNDGGKSELSDLNDETLDDLPEFQELETGDDVDAAVYDGPSDETSDEYTSDSDFSRGGEPRKSKGGGTNQDVETIAKAIQTVLIKDKA